MPVLRLSIAASLLLATAPAAAQAQSDAKSDIVVSGRLIVNGRPEPMSDWRVAETEHVAVYSRADTEQLRRVAANLEKLHFLLSVLMGRIDKPDDAIKLKVTLFGDAADFGNLDLKNVRWQQGPFHRSFPTERYYDPREDGPVLATTALDQRIMLQPGVPLESLNLRTIQPGPPGAMPQLANSMAGPGGATEPIMANEISFNYSAEGRLYSGFAQHYLLTYFPAAYPRWYLDGFGEIFATLTTTKDGAIEYGRAPEGFRRVIEEIGRYPVRDLLNGKYLQQKGRNRWTPYSAWAIAHLMFFSEQWHEPLRNYLLAVARGEPAEQAAAALGDIDKLQGELAGYYGRKVPFERMTFPADRVTDPSLRQLTKREATFIQGRLELGSRVTLPPLAPAGSDAETIADAQRERDQAIAKRDRWLVGMRRKAADYPADLEAQLLLAEAECRSGNDQACIAAADRAIAAAPTDKRALLWKGSALVRIAAAGPAEGREAKLKAARGMIGQANRADSEAPLPLLTYYRSFSEAGQAPPEVAVQGLAKVNEIVPSAPTPRLLLGEELARRGEPTLARKTLYPVALGAYDSPERPAAQQVLASLPKQ